MKFILRQKPLIALLIKRTVIFFFGLCVLSLFLYGVGTTQGFMDKTQFLLLRLIIVLGIFQGVGSVYGIICDIWLFCTQRLVSYLGGIGAYMLIGLCGIGIAAFAAFIVVVTRGNVA
jgi:hypothetical protein